LVVKEDAKALSQRAIINGEVIAARLLVSAMHKTSGLAAPTKIYFRLQSALVD
jgi:hypothetical protein